MKNFLKDFWPVFCKNLRSVLGIWCTIGAFIGLLAALVHFIVWLSEIIGMTLAILALIFICCMGCTISVSIYETVRRRKEKF